jgi:hypothetical protein
LHADLLLELLFLHHLEVLLAVNACALLAGLAPLLDSVKISTCVHLLLGLEVNLPVMALFTSQIEGTLLFAKCKSSAMLRDKKLHSLVDLVAVVTESVLLKLVVL